VSSSRLPIRYRRAPSRRPTARWIRCRSSARRAWARPRPPLRRYSRYLRRSPERRTPSKLQRLVACFRILRRDHLSAPSLRRTGRQTAASLDVGEGDTPERAGLQNALNAARALRGRLA
jgi:hypothetical protein